MKKLIVIAILFFASVYGFSQAQLIRKLYQSNISGWVGTFDPNAWVDSTDCNYTYNGNNLLATTDFNFVSPAISLKIDIDSNFYNSNKELLSTKKYLWDDLGKKWKTIPYSETKYIYSGSLLEKIEYHRPSQIDVDSFVYYSSKKLNTQYRFSRNNGSINFHRNDKYTYNSNGLTETIVTQKIYNGNWVNSRKETYTYNTSGDIAELVYEHYNSTTSVWDKGGSYDYSYNGKGEVSKKVHRSGNGQTYDSVVYVYNPNGTLKYEYFEKGYRAVYFYKNSTTSINNVALSNKGLTIYPNPSNGKFTVQFDETIPATITIVDISGKPVYDIKTNSSIDIDLSHLKKGIYVVNIASDVGVKTQRLVLQ